jgi:hypothetical protein
LVGNGDIVLGLPRCRDAQVKGGAQRHGHGVYLPVRSSVRPEQLVEQVGEPSLEHLHLSLGDGHALRPVVGDGLGREVALRRPAAERPRMAQQRFKLLGRGGNRLSDRPGHVGSITPAGAKQNSP